jgi:hypothetical protein
MLPVTGKFRGFKLDHFTRFYLKLAVKKAVFSPKLHVFLNQSNVLTEFFKNCNLAVKTAIFPEFFFDLRKTSRRFPGPVGPYRSQFGGL